MNENPYAPSPARLIESLRDTGYSFPMSVADIIDNSIAAGASKVDLQFYSEIDGELSLKIIDNGDGMNTEELINAMKYGSDRRTDPKSLGKFGMGLKTASTAFCRSLTVISNKDGVNARQWDIDEIINQDDWVLLEPSVQEEDLEYMNDFLGNETGTLVVWEKIDRLVKSKTKVTKDKQISKITEDLIKHLSGVFGRFIDSNKYDHDTVKITVNGTELAAWDPFCYWMGDKVDRVNQSIELTVDEADYSFDFNVHILPNKSEMDEEEQQNARYKNEALENQGFHIYRENRLIYSGGWPNRMFAREPHMNLIRIELNFDHEIDEYLQIDIKKSGVVLPTELFQQLKKYLTPLRREANNRYRTGKSKETKGTAEGKDIHKNSNKSIKKHASETTGSEVTGADPKTNTASVRNKFGTVQINIPVEEHENDVVVETKDMLRDGVLWNFAIINGTHGVQLNGGHEFYKRFYLNNIENTVLTQTMDFMFYSLAEAELSCVGDSAVRNFEEMRYSVSKILRRLAEELPEVNEE